MPFECREFTYVLIYGVCLSPGKVRLLGTNDTKIISKFITNTHFQYVFISFDLKWVSLIVGSHITLLKHLLFLWLSTCSYIMFIEPDIILST